MTRDRCHPPGRRPAGGPLRRLGLVAGLAAVALLGGCDGGEDDATAFEPDSECFGIEPVGMEIDEVECGMVEVPRDHDEPAAGSIELATAVLPAADDADDDAAPLLVLGGGPGEALVESVLTLPPYRQVLDVDREVIVIDQRGAGASDPALECPELPALETQETAAEAVEETLGALTACRQRLADDGIDLDAFNHVANARDVDAVRRALGHDELNVRGSSYGTQVALLAAERFPDTIRSVTLSSPIDPRENWIEGVPDGFERALDEVASLCANNLECTGAVGSVEGAIADTVDRLAEQPPEVTVRPPGGEETTVTYTPSAFLGSLFVLFYDGQLASMLPAFVDQAADGELQTLATIVATVEQQVEGLVTTGMQMSMICSGEGALAEPGAALADVDSQVLAEHWYPGDLLGEPIGDACQRWDVAQAYDPAEVTLDHDVPTLIVTGGLDHVTPPRLGEQVHQALPTSHLVEVAGAAHGPLETLSLQGGCGQQILGDFLADPATAPDASCAEDVQPQVRSELPTGGLGGPSAP